MTMEAGLAVLAGLVFLTVYAGIKLLQHRELEKAYRASHEATHDTDRGYFPDEYTGCDVLTCHEIAARFREAEEKWWMFGLNRERARAEVRMAHWVAMLMREES